MTKAKKRLLTLLLAMLMAVGMAVPTFAEEVKDGSYFLRPQKYNNPTTSSYCLNVVGNHEVSQNRDVNIYTSTGDLDQVWIYEGCYDGYHRLKSALSSHEYALNVYYPSTGATDLRCDIMQWQSNLYDSALWYGTEEFTPNTIQLSHYNYVLAVKNIYNSAPVVWHRNPSSTVYANIWNHSDYNPKPNK